LKFRDKFFAHSNFFIAFISIVPNNLALKETSISQASIDLLAIVVNCQKEHSNMSRYFSINFPVSRELPRSTEEPNLSAESLRDETAQRALLKLRLLVTALGKISAEAELQDRTNGIRRR
jgi:hypothetical protein